MRKEQSVAIESQWTETSTKRPNVAANPLLRAETIRDCPDAAANLYLRTETIKECQDFAANQLLPLVTRKVQSTEKVLDPRWKQ